MVGGHPTENSCLYRTLSLPLFLPVFRWFCCQFSSPENIWLVKSKHAVKNFMCYEPQKKTEMKFHNSSVRCFSCVIAYGNDYMGTYICIIYIKCSSLVSKDFVVVLDHSQTRSISLFYYIVDMSLSLSLILIVLFLFLNCVN